MEEVKKDRELLELAAKAAGIVGSIKSTADDAFWLFRDDNADPWNPLTNDGDALRLAVNLRLDLEFGISTVEAYQRADECYCTPEQLVHDKYAATRRAIVRAAAAIGEAMS